MPAFLEITTAIPPGGCGVRCCFCPADKTDAAYDGPRLMSLETFAACLGKMPVGTEVSFAGFSEPWLNNSCTAMAEHCHTVGVRWEAYTTCVGMSVEDVERIASASPQRIKLHLPDEEGYAKIRVDEHYISVVKRFSELFPANVMTMGTLHPAMRPIFGKIPPSHMHTRAGNVNEKYVPLRIPRKKGPLRCRPGPELDRNILLPDGRLVLCCMAFDLRHILGNLLTQSWESIREGKALADVRAAMASEDGEVLCRTCEVSIAA